MTAPPNEGAATNLVASPMILRCCVGIWVRLNSGAGFECITPKMSALPTDQYCLLGRCCCNPLVNVTGLLLSWSTKDMRLLQPHLERLGSLAQKHECLSPISRGPWNQDSSYCTALILTIFPKQIRLQLLHRQKSQKPKYVTPVQQTL